MWWKRKIDLVGVAYFRGTLPPRLHELVGLDRAGIAATEVPAGEGEVWRARLSHPVWGEADLCHRRASERIPSVLLEHVPGLTDRERDEVSALAESALELSTTPDVDDALRARKVFLQFLAAVLGEDGIVVADLVGQTFWTPTRLAEEVSHDAPLDICQMHVLHAVGPDEEELSESAADADASEMPTTWLHSHGLGEMGYLDFDILRPHPELMGSQYDVLRAIAFAIVEGAEDEIEPILGVGPVGLLNASAFMNRASGEDSALREAEFHAERRVVCVDLPGRGLLSRFRRRGAPRPARALERGMTEGQHLVAFSSAATELCAFRARETVQLLDAFRDEFEDLDVKALAKVGYLADSATSPDHREHLWFEIHGLDDQEIDATLLNEPFDIQSMSAGQHGRHPLDQLTDWALLTPIGQITPRNMEAARQLRELRPMIERAMAEGG